MANRKYEIEFKTMIVELLESGRSVREVSTEYTIDESLIRKWRKSYRENKGSFSGIKNMTPQEIEIKNLKKQLREVTEEREILKKAISIFSKSDQ